MFRTQYDTWVLDLLLGHFFRAGRPGQPVRLCVTPDVLDDLGRRDGWTHEDFLDACAEGSGVLPKRTDSVCEYAWGLYECWCDRARLPREYLNAPPFLGYLCLWAYTAAVEAGSYHRKLAELFPIRKLKRAPTMYPGFAKMRILWQALETWSTTRRDLGLFRVRRLGRLAHVSIPRSQVILTAIPFN